MGSVSSATSSFFTGSSQFSQDLQNVIQRAVGFASLPITQMNSQLTDLQNQSNALYNSSDGTGLQTTFKSLQTAVQGIADAMTGSSFQVDNSNTDAVNVSLDDSAVEGTYGINVKNVGSYASTTTNQWQSLTGTTGPQTYKLTIAGASSGDSNTTLTITTTDTTPAGVAAAINAQAGGLVTATVLNGGTNTDGTADTRLSLQATSLGTGVIQLTDPNNNDLASSANQTPGAMAQYTITGVNDSTGQPKVIQTATRTVTIANGVNVTLKATDNDTPVNITVTRSSSALSTALNSFVTAYNAAVDALTAQRGQNGGALAGNSIVIQLQQALTSLATYPFSTLTSASASSLSAQTGVANLNDVGLKLGDENNHTDPHMSFNQWSLIAKDFSSSASVNSFFGSPTSGGFLKFATDTLNSILDPTTGIIPTAESSFQDQISSMNDRISTKQDQVNQLQQELTTQMANADAALSSIEQQYNVISGMFQAQQTADQMYK